MIKVHVFEKDGIRAKDFDSYKPNKAVEWVNVVNPGKEDLTRISKKLGVTHKSLANCLDPGERARLENKDGHSIIILKIPITHESHTKTTSLGIIISGNYIMTIHPKADLFEGMIKELDLTLVHKHTYQYIFSQIMLKIVRDFYDILDRISDNVDELEDRLLKSRSLITIDKALSSKKTLLYFRKALITNRDVVISLEKGDCPYISKKSNMLEVRMDSLQLMDMEEIMRERLTEVASLYMAAISNNLNITMKYFTVVATLFLMPMLITSAYGMNFKIIPLAEHSYGFWIIVAVVGVAITSMFALFRRKDWI